MSRYDDDMRTVYNEKVYTRAIGGLFNLSKYDPLALPFYACLHAMVSKKRRIFDSPNLWIRIGGDKIKCLARVYCMGLDYEYASRHSDDRRELLNNNNAHIGSAPLEFNRLVGAINEAYKVPVEPETLSLMLELDTFLKGLKGQRYNPLENEFASNLSTTSNPIKDQVDKLKNPGTEVTVDDQSDHIETTIELDPKSKIEINNYFEVEQEGKILKHQGVSANIRGDTGDGKLFKLASDNVVAVTAIVRNELDRHHVETIENYKKERAKLDGYDSKIEEIGRKATEIYNKYYKASVEEIRDAQNLGKVTV
jgi:hypothetical protein